MTSLLSPAKINIQLTIEGRRSDGFHDLSSLVLPLAFGDQLWVEAHPGSGDLFECEDSRVPVGPENLILRAAEAFRQQAGTHCFYKFRLEKNIPIGGGFGGGSGNAVTALLAMNALESFPLGIPSLHGIAADLGSDCPFFLYGEPAVMKGRGEIIEPHSEWRSLFESWRIVLLDPGFGISTAWAFQEWARQLQQAHPSNPFQNFSPEDSVERFLECGTLKCIIKNDLGDMIRGKYVFYDALAEKVRDLSDVFLGITGSGSGCFFLCASEQAVKSLYDRLMDWFPNQRIEDSGMFLIETGLYRRQNSVNE